MPRADAAASRRGRRRGGVSRRAAWRAANILPGPAASDARGSAALALSRDLNLLISAGEASGDQHGARLLRGLRSAAILRRSGWAGRGSRPPGSMRRPLRDAIRRRRLEVFEKLPRLFAALRRLRREARAAPAGRGGPDRLSRFSRCSPARLHREGVPLVYYVSPQVWAWRRGPGQGSSPARRGGSSRCSRSRRRSTGGSAPTRSAPAIPWSTTCAKGSRSPSPLPPATRAPARPPARQPLGRAQAALGDDAGRSRGALARRFDLELVAVRAPGLPVPSSAARPSAASGSSTAGMHPLLASADLAVVASGTATLEAALCGAPMVVVYRTSRSSWLIARAMVRVPLDLAGEPRRARKRSSRSCCRMISRPERS